MRVGPTIVMRDRNIYDKQMEPGGHDEGRRMAKADGDLA